jgi:hypothetical protein
MLQHQLPPPYKPRTPRHPALQHYTATLDAFASWNMTTNVQHQLSVAEIYSYLKEQENYRGSYGAVRGYLRSRFSMHQTPSQITWEHLYEKIVSIPKTDAINLLRSLSFSGLPLISSARIQRLQREVVSLREHEVLRSRQAWKQQDAAWINAVQRSDIPPAELKAQCRDPVDFNELIARLRVGSNAVRNRATAILAHLRGISDHSIAIALGMSRRTIRRCRRVYESGGAKELFTRGARPGLKVNDEALKASIFALLHEPPANHGINRTTWIMADIRGSRETGPSCMRRCR